MTAIMNEYVMLDIYKAHQRELEKEARQYHLAHLKASFIKRLPTVYWWQKRRQK